MKCIKCGKKITDSIHYPKRCDGQRALDWQAVIDCIKGLFV